MAVDRNTIRITRRLREAAGYMELGMLDHALRVLPNDNLGEWEGPTFFLRGQILATQGDFSQAARAFRHAAEVSNYPQDRIAWMALSHCLRQVGDVDGAIHSLGRARGAFPRQLFLTTQAPSEQVARPEGRQEKEGKSHA